jgi:putative phosphoserine phosphatase/1-acylglycerol-3-phosphate O-acyltransferase
VPQSFPERRTAIFRRAERVLRRTRESVYLSPEGERITTGEIGHFNKGAFHLATALGAPIVPMYLFVPRESNPGKGLDARPGTVHVHFRPAIETRAWRVEDLARNRDHMREIYVAWHHELRQA